MSTLEERIATLALRTFDDLPNKSKPRVHPDGSREWVPMSAIVLVGRCKCLPASSLPKCHGQVLHDSHAEILALRGLNYFLLSEISHLLDDGNAYESPFISDRPSSASEHGSTAIAAPNVPFALRYNISIHMFSTEAPCGDASMEILISELGPEASLPWKGLIAPDRLPTEHSASAESLQGRGFFSELGIVRRKPSRADAEPTLSKSCTDKLSIKQLTSVLCFPTCHFIAPTPNAYLSSLTLPNSKYSDIGCSRAFSASGRLAPLQKLALPDLFSYRPFTVIALPKDFEPIFPFTKPPVSWNEKQIPNPVDSPISPTPPTVDYPLDEPALKPKINPNSNSKSKSKSKPKPKFKPSNLSALYIHSPARANNPRGTPITCTLLNGIHQGHTVTSASPLKASPISRTSLLQLGRQIASALLQQSNPHPHPNSQIPALRNELFLEALHHLTEAKTYREAKACSVGVGTARRQAKEVVTGFLMRGCTASRAGGGGGDGSGDRKWVRNGGDDDWAVL